MRRRIHFWRLVGVATIGAVEWFAFYDIYLGLILVTSAILGLVFQQSGMGLEGISYSDHIRSSVALVGPALVAAPWLTPKGDNDGLWLLIIPLLMIAILVAVALHLIGATVRVLPSIFKSS